MVPPGSSGASPWRLHLLANHHPALHGLRVLAIFAVVQLHVSVAFERTGLLRRGAFYDRSMSVWFAMDLFFFLSGFLIGTMLLRDETTLDARRAVRFWVRRAFRIVPPYLVVLTALACIGPLSAAQRGNLWREYAYLTNYFPQRGPPVMVWAWSLCVEEHFYLLVPLLVAALGLLASSRARAVALVLLWCSGLALRVGDVALFHPGASFGELFFQVYPRTHLRYDILVAGVLAAHLQHRHGADIAAVMRRPGVRVAVIAFVAGCFALLLSPPAAIPEPLRWSLWWSGLTSVCFLPLVLLVVNHRGAVGRALGHRSFLVVATLGYGVYLVHPAVIDRVVVPAVIAGATVLWTSRGVLLPFGVLWTIAVALAMAGSLGLAALLHLLVEKPSLALRDRLAPGSG